MDFGLISEAFPKLLGAVDETLTLAFSSVSIGFFFAIPIAVMRLSKSRLLSSFAYGYVYIFRSTPLLVQIFLIYYGSGQFREFFEQIGLWVLLKELCKEKKGAFILTLKTRFKGNLSLTWASYTTSICVIIPNRFIILTTI